MECKTFARACAWTLALCVFTASWSPAVAEKTTKSAKTLNKYQTSIFVTDLHCKKCARKMARKLYAVPGVVKVQTNLKKDVAIVTPEVSKQISAVALWEATEKAGFKPVKLVGPSGTFTKHPKRVQEDVGNRR